MRTDHQVDNGPAGGSVTRPEGASAPLPSVVWMHGGGTIIGNRHLDNAESERWAREISVCSVSVEYRLAPENPFPTPLEDCYLALSWAVAEADLIGVDVSRIAVGGKSAGGLLAAAVSLLRENAGVQNSAARSSTSNARRSPRNAVEPARRCAAVESRTMPSVGGATSGICTERPMCPRWPCRRERPT